MLEANDHISQVKEEDPYNHIGDSGGNISTSFIRRLRQSHDFDDTYSTVQDESGGDLKSVLESRGAARGDFLLFFFFCYYWQYFVFV